MRQSWKKTWLALVGSLLLIGVIGGPWGSLAVSEDRFEKLRSPLNDQLVIGMIDNDTGLMWGKELDSWKWLIFSVEAYVTEWANRENDDWGTNSLAGGYSDWRPATAGEILQAQADGLFNDFDFSHSSYRAPGTQIWDEIQSLNEELPFELEERDGHGIEVKEGGNYVLYTDPYYHYTDQYLAPYIDPLNPIDTWGEKWYSSCTFMQGGRWYRHTVRYGDGTSKLHIWPFPVIPVRGAPPNHDGCPKVKGSDIPDIPGHNKTPKPPKPPK